MYDKKKHTIEQFVAKARLVHGYYYDYTNTAYLGQMQRLIIECPKHGAFEVIANNHVHGTGCASCKRSRGETAIENWLIASNIEYQSQKTFSDLFIPGSARTNKPKFDFFVPHLNLLIEFDGKHHYEPVNFNGVSDARALELHHRTKLGDSVKDEYAAKHGIKLVRINYKDTNKLDLILRTLIK